MNESLATKWAAIRAQGRARYVWLHGVVLWGWPTAIVSALVLGALQGWDRLPIYLPVALISFSAGGYLAGAWGWARHEQEYQQRASKHAVGQLPCP